MLCPSWIVAGSQLWRNEGGYQFTAVPTTFQGMNRTQHSADTRRWLDYDGDGTLEFLWGRLLFQHDGAGTFTQIHEIPDITTSYTSGDQFWLDYDRDADIDIVTDFGAFINVGQDTFRRTRPTWTRSESFYHQLAPADYDNDGDPDLALGDYLLRNDYGRFHDTGVELASGYTSWADYDNDGDLALYLVGMGAKSLLYRNELGRFAGPDTLAYALHEGSASVSSSFRQAGAAWGDYDNDGDIDLAVQSTSGNGILRNDASRFTIVFDELWLDNGCGPRCGDYDADHDLDLLTCTGYQPNGHLRLFVNEDEAFALSDFQPPGFNDAVDWGDYDEDGDLDMVRAGYTRTYPYLYFNVGGHTPFLGGMPLAEMGRKVLTASFDWVDADSDGDLDLFATTTANQRLNSLIYENTGSETLQAATAGGLEAMSLARAAWGDLNNDGLPDAVLAGHIRNSNRRTYTYLNKTTPGTHRLIFEHADTLAAGDSNSPALADFDQDGDLDLVMTHDEGTVLYYNRTSEQGSPNLPPTAPVSLQATPTPTGQVLLSWAPATDDTTPAEALTYNVRVGTAPGRGDILSSMSNPDGSRLLVSPGNAGSRTSLLVSGLDANKAYFWSVQTLDQGMAASAFAPEADFAARLSSAPPAEVSSIVRVEGPFPNPFHRAFTFTYTLPAPSPVRFTVYDALGRQVFESADAMQPAGTHRQACSLGHLATGMYLYRLQTRDHILTGKVVRLID